MAANQTEYSRLELRSVRKDLCVEKCKPYEIEKNKYKNV